MIDYSMEPIIARKQPDGSWRLSRDGKEVTYTAEQYQELAELVDGIPFDGVLLVEIHAV